MKSTLCLALAGVTAVAALGATAVYTQSTGKDKVNTTNKKQVAPGGQDMQLPPGMTAEDMAKCMASAEVGPNQKFLTEGAGVWTGSCQMWMDPDAPPTTSECTSTLTPALGERYAKCEWKGDMGGMPFNGIGYYGFDNVSQKFQCVWMDNMGTGIATGNGVLAPDRKSMTWTLTFSCPITGKPTTMREVEQFVDANTRSYQMYSINPKTGKEYKSMEFKLTRKPGVATKESAE